MQTAKILVIDDEVKLTQIIKRSLEREGHTVIVANDSDSAREIIRQPSSLDIIFCDLRLPGDIDGISLLTEAKRYQPEADFIIITAYATVQTAVEALKKGAFDYLIKPVPLDELKLMVKRLLETRSLKEENVRLKEIIQEKRKVNLFSTLLKELLLEAKKLNISGDEIKRMIDEMERGDIQ
ncbi:MAG: response regulator [Candidatus Sumerlaeia bacterium]|nr:response regulator [Candidatus Sumerlaeia bacterium]